MEAPGGIVALDHALLDISGMESGVLQLTTIVLQDTAGEPLIALLRDPQIIVDRVKFGMEGSVSL